MSDRYRYRYRYEYLKAKLDLENDDDETRRKLWRLLREKHTEAIEELWRLIDDINIAYGDER